MSKLCVSNWWWSSTNIFGITNAIIKEIIAKKMYWYAIFSLKFISPYIKEYPTIAKPVPKTFGAKINTK